MGGKKKSAAGRTVIAVMAAAAAFVSCESLGGRYAEGEIRLKFSDDHLTKTGVMSEIPDTNDFILEIKDKDGEVVYSGIYGGAPESVTVPAGSCTVSVMSCVFMKPEFSMPQYGDGQCVVVPAGGVLNVSLNCVMMNSGIKLNVSPDFLVAYPSGVLFLKSDHGRLMYSYNEKRVAYFKPGNVSLVLNDSGKETVLFTRDIPAREVLVVGIHVSQSSMPDKSGIRVSLDTSKFWNAESFVIGGDGSKGGTYEDAMSVNQARASIGEKDVWVKGYIVGGDLTSSSASFSPPFKSMTNIAISARSSVASKESCLSVQLPSGEIREALNLVEHPQLLGRTVYINGDIVESYFSITGIKNVSDYVLE